MNPKKILQEIIREYNNEPQILKKTPVKETNGKFIKIGRKISIPNLQVLGLGRAISIGEKDWLVKSILNTKKIKSISEKGVSSGTVSKNIKFTKGSILLPSHLYGNLLTNSFHDLTFRRGFRKDNCNWNKLWEYNLIPFANQEMNKIIIIEEGGILWEAKKQNDSFLHVIEERGTWEIFTLNDLIIYPDEITILNIIKGKK